MNGETLLHNYYDDMEWMALALLRVYDATGREEDKEAVLVLWESIKTAWNDHMGGGMAWKKDQLDYRTPPPNAPASILASRLYQRFRRPEDLEWARKIYQYNKSLVDPDTGFVWDGINRLGDGRIDKDWEYTYCQGVFLGAGAGFLRHHRRPDVPGRCAADGKNFIEAFRPAGRHAFRRRQGRLRAVQRASTSAICGSCSAFGRSCQTFDR